jgi:CHAT domain-containing protein/tetratricopeptide (TPR) repeat protein
MPSPPPARLARLALLALLLCTAGPARAQPPLTDKQRELLKERDRHDKEWRDLERLGKLAEAVAAVQQMLAVDRKIFGDVHAKVDDTLRTLARLQKRRGELGAARQAWREVVGLREKLYGVGHWRTADARRQLTDEERWARRSGAERRDLLEANRLIGKAVQLYRQGKSGEALQPTLRAVEIRKKILGEAHPAYAESLNNLAMLHEDRRDHARAEPLLRQALKVYREALGQAHPSYATVLANLAALYDASGDHAKAEPLYQQALAIQGQTLGEGHLSYVSTLNNLAVLYHDRGDHARAEPLLQQVLQVRKQALGEAHPLYAVTLHNLATLYNAQGDHARAEPLLRQALQVRKQALGEAHPDYTRTLNNLALLHYARGDHTQAEPLFRQVLKIYQETLGQAHPRYATALCNLAGLHRARGDHARAESLYQRALAVARDNLELAAASQSERQQLALARALRFHLDVFLSLTAEAKLSAERAYPHVLAWKGAVFLRQRQQRLLRSARAEAPDPKLRRLFEDLEQTSRDLALVAFAAPPPAGQAAWKARLAALTERKEELEAELAGRSVTFRALGRAARPSPAELRAALPADAALVDFLEYAHSFPSAKGRARTSPERRLLAFVVRPKGEVKLVELGPAAPLAKFIDAWRRGIRGGTPRGQGPDPGATLRKQVWEPLEPHLKGCRVVLASPDGALCRLPLPALPGKKPGSYLIEEVALAVVPVPGWLPELLQAPPPVRGKADRPSLLALGDVDYGAEPGAAGEGALARLAPGRGLPGLQRWDPLPGTGGEVLDVRDFFEERHEKGRVTLLRKEKATEAAVRKEAPRHRFLHLATHGFFAPTPLRSALGGGERSGHRPGDELDPFGREGVTGWHPGLLSGLALAGANKLTQEGKANGILTALEVAGLDLGGVELAVLSACETGLGEQAGGEGLLGLQRAFQVAGARSVVATLWSVPDSPTRDLMRSFYAGLWDRKKPLGRLEALRRAQLWMLTEGPRRGFSFRDDKEAPPQGPRRSPPYYWAAFVLSGDWR